jgi:hypothetical protein
MSRLAPGRTTVELARCLQVRHRQRTLAERVEEQAEIVVRIGEVRVRFQGAPISLDGFVGASELLQEHGEIEVRDGVVGRLLSRRPLVGLRLGGLPGFVVEAAEVDVSVGHRGGELESLVVSVARFFR